MSKVIQIHPLTKPCKPVNGGSWIVEGKDS